MARRRFFVDEVRGAQAELSGEDAAHLTRVLRAEVGQRYEISDNRSVYLAEISATSKDRVVFRILEPLETVEPPVRLTLFASLIKFDRFEWIVEKATELDVEAIVPVSAVRSEAGLLEAAQKRVERWRKIVRESSQQSRRARLPEVRPPERLRDCLGEPSRYRFALEELPVATPLLAALPAPAERLASDTVSLVVGPEGGWTAGERLQFRDAGWTPVSVGPRILRTETAAIAASAILLNVW